MSTILVVEDRAVTRTFLSTLLGYTEHRILEAGDGEAALDIIKRDPPDLVITDILMPKMNGYDLAKKMRDDPALKKIPIIFYTATFRLEDATLIAMKCGVKFVLPKPSDPQLILDAVNKALAATTDSMDDHHQTQEGAATDLTEIKGVGKSKHAFSSYSAGFQSMIKFLREFKENAKADASHQDLNMIVEKFSSSVAQLTDIISRLFTLFEFNLDLFSEKNIDKFLTLFCKGARRLISARYCVLGIFDAEKKNLKYSYTASGHGIINDNDVPYVASDFVNQILKKKDTVRINNIFDPSVGFPSNHAIMQCVIGLPIKYLGKLYGFVYFADKTDGTPFFTDIDAEIAMMLSLELSLFYSNFTFQTEENTVE